MAWVPVSGLFLILHTLSMDRESLENPLTPVHMTLLGILAALGFSFLTARIHPIQMLAILLLSLVFTGVLQAVGNNALVFAGGWAVLAAWCGSFAFRGGVR
jgi:hypothetical protein